jgi:predicted AlkP superfamily pyrophosphatase or phosphodiesterase
MKKVFAICLALILAFGCTCTAFAAGSGSYGAYNHVVIVGIDGAGRFMKQAHTPNFDRIFKDGAVDYTARTETKSDSGPNWGAMLTGASFLKTKMQNGTVSSVQRTSDTKYPSVFNIIRQTSQDSVLASYVNWNAINYGIIETDIGVEEVNITDDAKLTDAICDYFDAGNRPTLFFVQLDSVDGAGHSYGSSSTEYFEAIETADGYLGRIFDALERNDMTDDTLFIVAADHGHMKRGGHGGITMRETNTTIAVRGKTVISGGTMDSVTRTRDVAALVLYALGIERPSCMTARVPANVFVDVRGEMRAVYKDPLDTITAALAWVCTIFTAWI